MKRALGYDPLPPNQRNTLTDPVTHGDMDCEFATTFLLISIFFPFSPKSAGRPLPIFFYIFSKKYISLSSMEEHMLLVQTYSESWIMILHATKLLI